MGINIADNFAYNGKKPLDNRTEYTTLSAMKVVADANINEGCICYNKEDGKYYTFNSSNTGSLKLASTNSLLIIVGVSSLRSKL